MGTRSQGRKAGWDATLLRNMVEKKTERLHYICCKDVSCNLCTCSALFLAFLFCHVPQLGWAAFHSCLVSVLFTGPSLLQNVFYSKFFTPSLIHFLCFKHRTFYNWQHRKQSQPMWYRCKVHFSSLFSTILLYQVSFLLCFNLYLVSVLFQIYSYMRRFSNTENCSFIVP